MPLLTKAKQRTVISALRDSNVRDIEQNYNEPAKLWCNEKWITAACLRCSDQRCIRYIDAEISCGSFSDFPYERNLNVCPVDAIKWNFEKELPEIENGKCIGCGLCAARCPVGAIFKADNKMKVSAPESDDYIDLPINYENLVKHKFFVQEVDKIYWNHQFQKESDRIMEEIYEKISHYDGRSMVPNVLVRNLIIALNHECAISRAGDIYTRMDAVYSSKIKPKCSGVVEIEFGRDTLEASRGILDDIAVMHSRNNLDKKDNAALVVCLSFPNKRQGYFQVIKDIHRVLDLKIQTISLGALLLLVWNGAAVNFLSREFYVDFDNLSFISEKNQHTECDVLIIDECSTVSNSDMRKVLEKAEFKLLVLVGDVYQIESIYFGNWFDIARNFISKDSIFELTHPYRTQNENLLTVWERVRNLDIAILEPMVKSKYSIRLDESIFSHAEEDEIILCLNYDGLYGINNINRFLQNSNPSPAIQWGIGLYKVGDPVLFNESDRFSPLIHNNSKGRIVGITTEEMQIWFEIELDCVINELDAWGYDFELMDASESGNSIIKFSVDKYRSTDEDDDYSDTVVPFQVAYAVSIHKAQGLEYRSVKIVITNETEERITHNIFYTAITRAKENLKIYWSPETEKSVLEKLSVRDSRRDANLLKQLYSL